MEINKRFKQLERPSKDYLGEPLDLGKFSRDIYLAKNKEEKNCFLIRVQFENKPFRAPDLKDIQVIYQVRCTIETEEGLDTDDFTIIEFTANDNFKQELFFSQMQSIFEKIEFPCKTSEISTLLETLFSLFKLLSRPGKSKKQGLWAELYLIYKSKDPRKLIQYWHINSNERYDFSDGKYRLEVKSCGTSNYRKHKFSYRQSNPPKNTEVLIASVIAEEVSVGLSIKALYDSLVDCIEDDIELLEKLNFQCAETLGQDFEKNMGISFDEYQAEDSLEFFDLESIPKIENELPPGVEEVTFTSDFSIATAINRKDYADKSDLFNLSIKDA